MLPLFISLAAATETPEFKPEIQVRPRVEVHTGRDGADGGEIGFVVQRTRVGGTLIQGELSARVVLQDVRTWGEEVHTLFDFNADNLDLHAGHLNWKPTEGAELIVGRQSVAIHEHRLVGNVDWTAQARAFDGAMLKWKADRWSVDAAGLLVASRNAIPGYDSTLGVLRAGRADDNTTADLLYLPLHDASRERLSHTAGVFTKVRGGPVAVRAEAYVQAGQRDGDGELAWMAGLEASLSPDVTGSPRITLWYDHLSGDPDPTDGVARAFDTLFDTRHKFYGLIDVMNFGVAGAADGLGLQDAAIKLAASATDSLNLGLDAHLFAASARQNGGSVLGQEFDAVAKIKVTPGFTTTTGGAVLTRTGIDPDLWGFVQLNATLK